MAKKRTLVPLAFDPFRVLVCGATMPFLSLGEGNETSQILRVIRFIAIIIAALTGSASAQQFMPGINLDADKRPLSPEEKEKRKAIDEAYRSTIEKLPDQKKPADAWGNIRSAKTPSSKQGQ